MATDSTPVMLSPPQCRFTYHLFATKRQSQSIGEGEKKYKREKVGSVG